MKKQITILSLLILVTATLFSCKKDTTSVKARIMGKWSISRIETTGYTPADLVADPTRVNGTITGLTGDYMDFKADNDDQVELNVKGNRTIGTYTGTMDTFNMSFPEGAYYCSVEVLQTNTLEFTAKLDKTNVVKKFYLKR